MNIFFFGSTSFAAQSLIKELELKYNVYSFSRNKKLKKYYFFNLNNINKKTFKNIKVSKIDYLFFFSSLVPIKESKSKWTVCKKINVYGLIDLLTNIKIPIKKIILASSCSLYGYETRQYNEESFLRPSNGYAFSKFIQEKLLSIFCKKNKIKLLIYRFGYVFGKNMDGSRLVKKIILRIKNKKKLNIYNKNLNLNLVHQEDVSNLVKNTFKSAEGIFNITNLYKTSLIDFCKISLGKKINKINKKNNYQSKKMFKEFQHLKKPSLIKGCKIFLYEN